jgi:hypothetical protein
VGDVHEYRERLAEIREEYSMPKLAGTLDIYPTDEAYILASGDAWNPRPIIQSYAAWTPKLALINEQHLRTDKAPDYLLFGFLPQDKHLPSLDDGVSWTALLDNYTVARVDEQFAYLHKRDVVQYHSDLSILQEGVYKTGESVVLPEAGRPIFAAIDLEPTLFGKLMETVFKPTQGENPVEIVRWYETRLSYVAKHDEDWVFPLAIGRRHSGVCSICGWRGTLPKRRRGERDDDRVVSSRLDDLEGSLHTHAEGISRRRVARLKCAAAVSLLCDISST